MPERVAVEPPLSSSSAFSSLNSRSQVLGSSVHSPEGQSEAPSAEHCPAQLAPWPQVTTLGVLSGWQQVTLLVWLEKVNALSKKSTEGTVLVFPGYYCLVIKKIVLRGYTRRSVPPSLGRSFLHVCELLFT